MRISARFTQGIVETKRYVLDYTLFLTTGEQISAMATPVVTAAQNQSDSASPSLEITDVVIGPGGLQVVFYASGGVANGQYEVSFVATTTVAQQLQDVVQFNIRDFTQ